MEESPKIISNNNLPANSLVTVSSLYNEVIKNRLFIFICAMSTGVSTLLLSLMLQPWFAYNGLIKVADLGVLGSPMGKESSKMPMMGMGGASSTDLLKGEVVDYIKFKYIDPQKMPGTLDPYVKTIWFSNRSNLIFIETRATSNEDARNFLNVVLSDIQTYFKPKIDAVVKEAKDRVVLLSQRSKSLEDEISTTQSAMMELGFSPNLRVEIVEMEKQEMGLKAELIQLQSATSAEKVYNFQFISTQPFHPFKPVFPRKGIFSMVAFIIGAIIGIYFVIMKKTSYDLA